MFSKSTKRLSLLHTDKCLYLNQCKLCYQGNLLPTMVHGLNRHVFTKCSLRVIYMAEVTDCSLIEWEKNTHPRGAMKA